jgi:hypothetical protein
VKSPAGYARRIPKFNPVIHLAWIALIFSASCRSGDRRPEAPRVPVAEIEKTFGRLISVANAPTPDQHRTGDMLGLFRADDGTIWGIPLTADENGNLLACAPPALRDAPASGTLPDKSVEIIGAANEPNGWRGGTGKLTLLLRDPQGGLRWQPIESLELKTGPVCMSQSPPVQPLRFYRLARPGK